jgi:hypothetical protein
VLSSSNVLESAGSVSWIPPGATTPPPKIAITSLLIPFQNIALRLDDTVYVARQGPTGSGTELKSYDLLPATIRESPLPPTVINGTAMSAERGTLWVLANEPSGAVLQLHSPGDGGWSVEPVRPELGAMSGGELSRSPVVGYALGRWVLPRRAPEGLHFVQVEADQRCFFRGANDTIAWEQCAKQTRVFPR